MKLLKNLSGWFADLQPRERVIVAVGAALLAIAALYTSLLPAMQTNAELEQRYSDLSEDMEWLREQVGVVSRLTTSCAGQAIQSGKKKAVITRILRRNQLKLLGLGEDELTAYSISVSAVSPNRILQTIHQLTCQGLALESLDVNTSTAAKVGYIANIEVAYVD